MSNITVNQLNAQVANISGGITTTDLSVTANVIASNFLNPSGGFATREILTGSRTYYVRNDGSDSNNGFANTAGGAFLTIQKAIDTIYNTLDTRGNPVTIQLATGTYAGFTVPTSETLGGGSVTLLGDAVTPGNCLITSSSTFTAYIQSKFIISGVKFVNTNGAGISVEIIGKGYLNVNGNVEYGSAGATGIRVRAIHGGVYFSTGAGTEYISGNAHSSYYSISGGKLIFSGTNWANTGGTANSSHFVFSTVGSTVFADTNNYTGAFQGERYHVTLGSVISTNGGGPNTFPGSVAGSSSSGGIYV